MLLEALAKPQVSPLALQIQPLSGLSQVSPGVKATGSWGYSFNNINPVGVECEEQEVKPGETFKKSFARGSLYYRRIWAPFCYFLRIGSIKKILFFRQYNPGSY